MKPSFCRIAIDVAAVAVIPNAAIAIAAVIAVSAALLLTPTRLR